MGMILDSQRKTAEAKPYFEKAMPDKISP